MEGPQFHREIGEYARAAGISRVFAVGDLAREVVDTFGAGALHVANVEALAAQVCSEISSGTTILVKGSRFMRMERVVDALTGQRGGGAH